MGIFRSKTAPAPVLSEVRKAIIADALHRAADATDPEVRDNWLRNAEELAGKKPGKGK